MDEIWKDVDGWEGMYQISNLGRVKSISRMVKNRNGYRPIKDMILSIKSKAKGYFLCTFSSNSVLKVYTIHRLIAIAFIPNPENKPEVNHKNGIRTDNRIENLEWVTKCENIQHAYDTGLATPYDRFGSKNPKSKITYQYDTNESLLNKYNSAIEASVESGVSHHGICANARHKTKTAGGFIWRYEQI